jgi:hypothetical protein
MLMMYAFVCASEFHGQHSIPEGRSLWNVFLRFTVAGYAVALLISFAERRSAARHAHLGMGDRRVGLSARLGLDLLLGLSRLAE